jgi:hypothetical protein
MLSHLTVGLSHYLSRISPILGLGVICFSLALDSATGATSLWISGVGIVVGVSVALGGMLYHNMESRVTKLETDSLTRREFEIAHTPVQDQLGRIEGHLINIDNRNLK